MLFIKRRTDDSPEDSFVDAESFPRDRVKGHFFFGHTLDRDGSCEERKGVIIDVATHGNHLSFIDERQREAFGFDYGDAAWGEEGDDIIIVVPLQAEITIYDTALFT